jgi:hypothetical protein
MQFPARFVERCSRFSISSCQSLQFARIVGDAARLLHLPDRMVRGGTVFCGTRQKRGRRLANVLPARRRPPLRSCDAQDPNGERGRIRIDPGIRRSANLSFLSRHSTGIIEARPCDGNSIGRLSDRASVFLCSCIRHYNNAPLSILVRAHAGRGPPTRNLS